jgi:hypothetical protein|nr:MAG TPA: hypothetical protein [Caudoviricetes sp.]
MVKNYIGFAWFTLLSIVMSLLTIKSISENNYARAVFDLILMLLDIIIATIYYAKIKIDKEK